MAAAAFAPNVAASTLRAHCVVPRGWSVVAEDSYAVVISSNKLIVTGQTEVIHERWRYCVRKDGRFQSLAQSTNIEDYESQVGDLVLAGPYAAYETVNSQGRGEVQTTGQISLWNLARGKRRDYGLNTSCGSPLLAPTGVGVAEISPCFQPGDEFPPPGPNEIVSFDRAGHLSTLASENAAPTNPSPLANLQLLRCVAGCSGGLVVWWTDNGAWHSAGVS